MDSNSARTSKTVAAAKALMASLELRASDPEAMLADRFELSALTTTVRKTEEFLAIATEFEEVLIREMLRTEARIAADS